MSRGRRRMLIGLAVVILILISPIVVLFAFQNRIIFPTWTARSISAAPAGTAIEDVYFTSDGHRLHGWYLPHSAPRGHLLFHHGNGGNVAIRREMLEGLRDGLGLSVFAYDYRGYGQSEGSPTEQGVLADGKAALDWLNQRTQTTPGDIIQYGESLGGAVAVDVAARYGAGALVVDKSFDSLENVAAEAFPYLPVRYLMATRLCSADKIPQYQGPFLQVHSRNDTLVRFERGCKLFERANEPKTFVEVEGPDHNDPYPPSYFEALDKFLARWLESR